jgi:hypothetical protein
VQHSDCKNRSARIQRVAAVPIVVSLRLVPTEGALTHLREPAGGRRTACMQVRHALDNVTVVDHPRLPFGHTL